MNWSFDSKLPIYTQLVDQMRVRIITGAYPPGSRLDSVRDLASQAGVNPNTMQRALSSLEEQGLVYSQRTAGRFITEDAELIAAVRNETALARIRRFADEMDELGFSKGEILELMEELENER